MLVTKKSTAALLAAAAMSDAAGAQLRVVLDLAVGWGNVVSSGKGGAEA